MSVNDRWRPQCSALSGTDVARVRFDTFGCTLLLHQGRQQVYQMIKYGA